MKLLIIYFSFSGNNEMLVDDLKKRLGCEAVKIIESKKRKDMTILFDVMFNRTPRINNIGKNLEEYDHIILIAPIWAGKIASPLKSLLLLEKENIHDYSFICVCSGVENQKEKIQTQLTNLLRKKPVIVTELWINDLLPADQKNKIKYVTPYRLQPKDFVVFAPEIEKYITVVSKQFKYI
ncbi:NAD(P)H-dependent oxidoreductase [Chryseolinea sp. H1M3-3]|uniref:flavodoxin family protein n=1 Tax=Chryseolinea sp. H1M3-3 TaxID=3034144 RepID=UPI0023EC992C|nr:NAD(P)H-dependent oxidoreductase [Chryseolinea sp. H1M3-3]